MHTAILPKRPPKSTSTALEFLTAVHGNSPGHIVLWSQLKSKNQRTQSFSSDQLSDLLAAAQRRSNAGHETVSYSVTTQAEAPKGYARGGRSTALAVPGIALDVDLENPRKHQHYPTRDVVDMALAELPPCSAIISTGSGLHVYWLFDQPFVIGSEEQRAQIDWTLKQFEKLYGDALERHNNTDAEYSVDGVAELARVMRVPGTVNPKWNVEAAVEYLSDTRHSFEFIESLVPEKPKPRLAAVRISPDDIDEDLPRRKLSEAIARSATANRNEACFWMACQLRDNLVPLSSAELLAIEYAQAVTDCGGHPFTDREALKAVQGAYKNPRPGRTPEKQKRQRRSSVVPDVTPDIPYVEPTLVPIGKTRNEMTTAVLAEDRPQRAMLCSEPGTGKSTCSTKYIRQRMSQGANVCLAVPTNVLKGRTLLQLRSLGIHAVCTPHRDEHTCGDHYEQVGRLHGIGLPASMACEKHGCKTLEQAEEVREALKGDMPVCIVTTHDYLKHASAMLLSHDCEMIVDEEFVPWHGDYSAKQLGKLRDFVDEALPLLSDGITKLLVERIKDWLTTAESRLADGSFFIETSSELKDRQIRLSRGSSMFGLPDAEAWNAEKEILDELLTLTSRVRIRPKMLGAVARLFLHSGCGWCVLPQDDFEGHKGEAAVPKVVLFSRPLLSSNLMLMDGTGNPEMASDMLGIDGIEDITPPGVAPLKHPITQIPFGLCKSTDTKTIVGWERAICNRNEGQAITFRRKSHHDDIAKDDSLIETRLGERLANQLYIRGVESKGVNGLNRECDFGITFLWRPHTNEIRLRLLLTGNHESAARELPARITKTWQAKTVNGEPKTIQYDVFDDPSWAAMEDYLIRANMLQTIARWRSILDEGKPVFVVSDYPLDPRFLIDESITCEPLKTRNGKLDVQSRVRELTDRISQSEVFPNFYLRKNFQMGHSQDGILTTDEVMTLLELDPANPSERKSVQDALHDHLRWHQHGGSDKWLLHPKPKVYARLKLTGSEALPALANVLVSGNVQDHIPTSVVDAFRETGEIRTADVLEWFREHGLSVKTARNELSRSGLFISAGRRGVYCLSVEDPEANRKLRECDPEEPDHDASEQYAERAAIAEESGVPREHAEHLAAQQCPELSSDVITQPPDLPPDESLEQLARTPEDEAPESTELVELNLRFRSEPERCACGSKLTRGPGYSEGLCHTCQKRRYRRRAGPQSQLCPDATKYRGGPISESIACQEER